MERTFATTTASIAALGVAAAWLAVGCGTSDPRKTKIVVPSAATSTPEYEGDGSIPEQRYVIRMSDGQRDWEVEFPSVATGYEMHIPLDSDRSRPGLSRMRWSSDRLTEADKELLRHLRRQNPEMEREGVYRGGRNVLAPRKGRKKSGRSGKKKGSKQEKKAGKPGTRPPPRRRARRPRRRSKKPRGKSRRAPRNQKGRKQKSKKGERGSRRRPESRPAPTRPSYLLGLEEVRRLYRKGQYELALVRLKKLEEAYPDDVQILSMKGTLWLKLGRPDLARKAWERVLQIDRDNEKVKEALQRLNKGQSE